MRKKPSVNQPLRNDVQSVDDEKIRVLNADAINRRTFVKKGSGLLIVAGVGACVNPDSSNDPGTVTGPTGSVRLILAGLHPSATSGGSATITSTKTGGTTLTVDIPASGDQTAVVPIGDYTVQYSPPANHQLVPGQPNPRTVAIEENLTTTVTENLVAQGRIQLAVTGFTGGQPNGGSAVAQRTDATASPIAISVSAAGSGGVIVPSGTYTVTYNPPSGYNVDSSSTNPVTGVVVSLQETEVDFVVSPVAAGTGSVLVTITGLTGATAGGQVSAKLTDNGGSTFPATLPPPTGGSTSSTLTGLPPGSYNVTYTPPPGYRLLAGTQNPRVVTVTSGATASATFPSEAIPPSGGLVYASDWRTATGTSNNAKSDGGKWNDLSVDGGGPANRIEVISAAGLSFPSGMANVLKVLMPQANWQNSYWNILVTKGWALPAIGGSIYFRLYFRHDVDGSGGDDMHNPQTGPPGSCPYTRQHVLSRPNTTALRFAVGNKNNDSTNVHVWECNKNLARQTTYRVEEQYIRQATNSWKVHVRVYDSSDTMIASDPDFIDGYTGIVLSNFTGTITSGTDCLRNWMIGFPNQLCGSDTAAHQHCYYGGYAVSLTDWCGAYVPGE